MAALPAHHIGVCPRVETTNVPELLSIPPEGKGKHMVEEW